MPNNPTLETIKMVEESIAMNNGKFGKYQLWRMLPRRMMYQTYQEAISHLVWANRIELRNRKLFWTFDKDIEG